MQLEMLQQKKIFDNTEIALEDRLVAYTIYADKKHQLTQMENDREADEIRSHLKVIEGIEKEKAKGKISHEKEVQLLNKANLLKQLDVLNRELDLKMEQDAQEIGAGLGSIISSGLQTEFKNIEALYDNQLEEIRSRYNIAEEEVENSSLSPKKKAKRIKKLEQGAAVEGDEAKLEADQEKIKATEEELQIAHNSGLVELEAKLQRELLELRRQEAEDKKKLNKDMNVSDKEAAEERKKIAKAAMAEALEVGQSIANDYMDSLARRDAEEERVALKGLEWSKKASDAQVQSNAEKKASDKAYQIAQEQIAKEKAMKDKQRAKAQMAIDLAMAIMRIWATSSGPWYTKLIETAGVSAIYAAKLATVESQQFRQGGEVPSSGGMFGGRSHSSGGTPFMFKNRSFTAEADELAIINKRSSGSNQVMTLTGTPKQIASGLNSWGGGVNFAPGAVMHKFEYGGMLGGQVQPPQFTNDYAIHQAGKYRSTNNLNNDIAAINHTLQKQAEVLSGHAQALQHESSKQVVLNPHAVSSFQKSNSKNVNVGTL